MKLYVQGLAHEQLGQYPEAVQVYEEALALNPKLALSVGWVQWLSGSRQSSRMQPVIPLRLMKRKPKPGLPRLFDRPKYRQRNIIPVKKLKSHPIQAIDFTELLEGLIRLTSKTSCEPGAP